MLRNLLNRILWAVRGPVWLIIVDLRATLGGFTLLLWYSKKVKTVDGRDYLEFVSRSVGGQHRIRLWDTRRDRQIGFAKEGACRVYFVTDEENCVVLVDYKEKAVRFRIKNIPYYPWNWAVIAGAAGAILAILFFVNLTLRPSLRLLSH